MKRLLCGFIIFIFLYFFTTLLTGCGGGGSGGGSVSAITGANPLQDILSNDSKNSTININSNGKANSLFNGIAGLMNLDVPEENTLNTDVVIKISERLSTGSENSLLTPGSVIYTINPIKNDLPIKLTTKPFRLVFSNEDKFSKAESYYIGIKEIDGGKWQFASLYAANSSSRASVGPKGPFEFDLYKENVYVALFADLNNSAKDLGRVLGINATTTFPLIHSYKDKYTEDIKISIGLNGDNLGRLKSDDIVVRIGFGRKDKNNISGIGIDGKTAKYPVCDSINKYELAGENYAYYYKFSPLSTNFKSQSVPQFSFDLNLKGTQVSGFSSDFVIEISNANDNVLPFCYFYPVHFDIEEKKPDSEGDSKPNDETQPSDETQPGDKTQPTDENQPDEEPQTIIPANASLKSSADDFKVSGDKIEIEFDKDIPWSVSDKDKISIDNGAFVSSCEYSNKVLKLSLNSKLKYDSDYKISLKGLKYVKDNNFTFKTERKARVSLKSPTTGLSIASGAVELEFSKDILWNQNYSKNITIDNNAEISNFSYNNKILKIFLKNNLLYNARYNIKITGIDAVEDNDSLEFATEESILTPVIIGDESNHPADLPDFYKLKPIIVFDFGMTITNKELALSKIKINDNLLPQSCKAEFLENNRKAVITFTEDLEKLTVYKLNISEFKEADGSIIVSAASDFVFETIPSDEILGSGTEKDPFRIYTEAHLRKLNETETVNYKQGGYFFKQMNDIVLRKPWIPIGLCYEDLSYDAQGEPFIGTYNGGGFCISGIDISIPKFDDVNAYSGIGLLGSIKNSKIENLNIRDFSIFADENFYAYYVGSVIGVVSNSELKNVNVSGNISINYGETSGGLVGCVFGSNIDGCSISSANGRVKSDYNAGGFVGYVDENTTITNSFADISVFGDSGVGGFAGTIGYSIIEHCCVSSINGLVKGSQYVGGLVGYVEENSTITNSFSSIKIIGNSGVGGLIGYLTGSTVANCYSRSNITNNVENDLQIQNIGGLLGYIYSSSTDNCYASGSISINGDCAYAIGVIAGNYKTYNSSTIINNTFSTSNITIENPDNYTYYSSESGSYNPNNQNIPLWWNYSSFNDNQNHYEYSESGTNYAGNGYKSQLNWDSNTWSNLTEGKFPKLNGFQNQ